MHRLLAALLSTAALAATAPAASYCVCAETSYYDPNSFVELPDYDINSGDPVVLGLDFYAYFNALNPDEAGFGNVVFTVEFGGAIVNDLGGYNDATDFTYDANGPLPGGDTNYLSINQDAGTAGDLVDIVAEISSGISDPSDPRYTVFQPGYPNGPFGNAFFSYSGGGPAFISITPTQGSYHTADGTLVGDNQDGVFIATIPGLSACPDIPEPTSALLAALGDAGLLARRSQN